MIQAHDLLAHITDAAAVFKTTKMMELSVRMNANLATLISPLFLVEHKCIHFDA